MYISVNVDKLTEQYFAYPNQVIWIIYWNMKQCDNERSFQ